LSAAGRDEKFDATILIVDDKEDNRAILRAQLRTGGYTKVLEAESKEDAIAKIGELLEAGRAPDLVLLDVMMPDVDGWTVARELAEDDRTREIPVVFLTARAEAADKRMGQQLGGVGYLVKPFDPVTIGDFVEGVIERVERGEREQLTRGITSTPDR
jgi:CheY-like chemotaxis protein